MKYLFGATVLITLLLPRAEPQQVMLVDVRMLPTVETMIVAEAMAQSIPAHQVLAIAWRESKFNPLAISATDDYSVMQLHRSSWKHLTIDDLMNPAINIREGVKLWAKYFKSGGEAYAMCAYAHGPGSCR